MDSKTLWTRVISVVTFEGLALWTVLAVECAEPCPVDVLLEVLGEVESGGEGALLPRPSSLPSARACNFIPNYTMDYHIKLYC